MEKLAGDDDQIEFDYPKALFILDTVLAIEFFIAFIFFLFMTVFVIRKEKKLDKVLVTMLVFLQLAALSLSIDCALYANDNGKSFT